MVGGRGSAAVPDTKRVKAHLQPSKAYALRREQGPPTTTSPAIQNEATKLPQWSGTNRHERAKRDPMGQRKHEQGTTTKTTQPDGSEREGTMEPSPKPTSHSQQALATFRPPRFRGGRSDTEAKFPTLRNQHAKANQRQTETTGGHQAGVAHKPEEPNPLEHGASSTRVRDPRCSTQQQGEMHFPTSNSI